MRPQIEVQAKNATALSWPRLRETWPPLLSAAADQMTFKASCCWNGKGRWLPAVWDIGKEGLVFR